MDKERIEGFRKALEPGETYRWEIPKTERERMSFYEDKYMQLLKRNVTAVFAVSDFYALEFMKFLQGKNIRIPEDIQIIGFFCNKESKESNTYLTKNNKASNVRAKFMKSLCKIAIPVTLQSMLQASFSIVDQIMIGQLGETNISAVGLCGNFSLIFQW